MRTGDHGDEDREDGSRFRFRASRSHAVLLEDARILDDLRLALGFVDVRRDFALRRSLQQRLVLLLDESSRGWRWHPPPACASRRRQRSSRHRESRYARRACGRTRRFEDRRAQRRRNRRIAAAHETRGFGGAFCVLASARTSRRPASLASAASAAALAAATPRSCLSRRDDLVANDAQRLDLGLAMRGDLDDHEAVVAQARRARRSCPG